MLRCSITLCMKKELVMENERITVVVPIYNTAKYLDRCLSSIVKQSYKNLEVILINDGSTDDSLEICNQWCARDKRISVISKSNQGQGMARNTGIAYATGAYICFIDSDDYVSREYVEKAYLSAKEHHADMVCFGMKTVSAQGQVIGAFVPVPGKKVYRDDEVLREFLPMLAGPDPKTGEGIRVSMSCCCKLFSMAAIRRSRWQFVSEREIISEDFYSILDLCAELKTVSIVPEGLYFYCQNPGSFSRGYRADRFERICEYYQAMENLCRRPGYGEPVLSRVRVTYLSFVITALKQEIEFAHADFGNISALSRIIDHPLLQQVLEEVSAYRLDAKKKLLFWAMRKKQYGLCYLLLVLNSGRKKLILR